MIIIIQWLKDTILRLSLSMVKLTGQVKLNLISIGKFLANDIGIFDSTSVVSLPEVGPRSNSFLPWIQAKKLVLHQNRGLVHQAIIG